MLPEVLRNHWLHIHFSENADHESSAIQVRLNLALNQLTEQNLAKGGRKSPVFWTTEPITQEPEVRF